MSTRRRSVTGCTFCKARRKKCDETKPQCRRCLAAGISCNYEYLEVSGNDKRRVKRTKPGPRSTRELVEGSHIISSNLPEASRSSTYTIVITGGPTAVTDTHSGSLHAGRSSSDSSAGVPLDAHRFSSLSLVIPVSSGPLYVPNKVDSSPISPHLVRSSTSTCDLASASSDPIPGGLKWLDPNNEDDKDDEEDPEGVRALLCIAPALDRNARENSLPFVLHCYSQWAIAILFEPLKVVHALRDQVISRFSAENARQRTILIANVMIIFARNFAIDGIGRSMLNHLVLDVQKNSAEFLATPLPFMLELDRQNALQKLDGILEILALRLDMQSTQDSLQSLAHFAPIFRRACSEPPGKPINLPNTLLSPSISLRYFATVDINMSVVTGLPTHFHYQVPFSPELCHQVYHWQLQGSYGLQWLFRFPDQFTLLFAWVNTLSETPGAGENTKLIARVEKQLPEIKFAIDQSGDPLLRIGRMVVLECWGFAALVYPHMVLCKADSHDPRVVHTQKGFMRLVRGVKQGRCPDALSVAAMFVVGVATVEEHDRNTLGQRILGIREYADQGTAGNDLMLRLEDIWTRTNSEGRGAMWSDLRVAYARLLYK